MSDTDTNRQHSNRLSRRSLAAGSAALLPVLLPRTTAGQSGTPTGSPAASPAASTEYTVEPLAEPVSVTLFAGVNSREAGPPPDDWTWPAKVKEDLNIDVTVQWVTDPTQYTENLRARAAANDLPDVFTTSPSTTELFADQGLLGDWAPLYESMPHFVVDRNVEQLAQIGTIDGVQYGLISKNANPFKQVWAVRGDWLENLGLEIPTTTEELLEVGRAFTEDDPTGTGAGDTYGFTGYINFEGYVGGFGAGGAFNDVEPWRVVDGGLQHSSVSEEHRQALEFMSQLVAAGVVDPDYGSQEELDSDSKWKSGKIGIIQRDWCSLYCVQGYSEFKGAVPEGTFTMIDAPAGPDGHQVAGSFSNVGTQFAISQRAIDEGRGEAVAKLLEWINGPGYVLSAFGEEGISWDYDNEGVRIQEPSTESIQRRQLVVWSYRGTPDEWETRYKSVTEYDNGEVIDVYSILEAAQEQNIVDVTQWAIIPPVPADVYADFVRTQAEGEFQFISGGRSFDEWDAHVEAMKAAGLDQWTEVAVDAAREAGIIS